MIQFLLLLSLAQFEDEPGGARVDPDETPEVVETLEQVPTSTSPALERTACPKEADIYYSQGFDDLTQGEPEHAYVALTRALEICPHHPFAAELARLALATPPRKKDTPRKGPDLVGSKLETEFGPEKPSLLARGELVAFQTFHGLVDGLLLCPLIQCDDGRLLVGLGLLGTAGIGGLALGFSGEIRSGQALVINSGTGWGFWHGLTLALVTEVDDGQGLAAMFLLANLAGTGAGIAIASQLEPLNGQVSFANSAGIWSIVVALMVMNAAEMNIFETEEFWAAELIVGDLGLALGAYAATRFDISRGRTLLIDAGGLAGLLLGLGVAVLVDEEPGQSLVGVSGLIGTLAGLSSVFYLSRNIDAPEPPKNVMFLPGGPRGTLGATLAIVLD